MAKRRTRRRRRMLRALQNCMTVLCVLVLVAGSVYFVNEKLERDRVKSTNEDLRALFYGKETAQPPVEATVAPVVEVTPTPAVESEAVALVRKPRQNPDAAQLSLTAEAEEPQSELVALSAVENTPNPFEMPAAFDMPIAVDTPIERVLQSQFEALYAQNSDLIGWIKMADSVDYPVLYRDNSFYMDHDFYGQYSQAGSIFLDARNGMYMNDSAMLIYGHNMRSGEMFGDLDEYRETKYLCKYPIISLQSAWESEPRQYVLISLFDASMNKSDPSYIKIVRTAFETDEEKQAFIDEMRARSIYKIPLEADANDQLLTLVTCSYSHDNGRFLLFARQLRDDETEESIMEQFQSLL